MTLDVVELSPKFHPEGGRFLVKPYPKSKRARRFKLEPELASAVLAHVERHGLGPNDLIFRFDTFRRLGRLADRAPLTISVAPSRTPRAGRTRTARCRRTPLGVAAVRTAAPRSPSTPGGTLRRRPRLTTTAPLATKGPHGKPQITTATWPIVVKDAAGAAVNDAWFMASVARREEKGSDVNVAAHLLVDVLQADVGAAVVISNDSDLKYPIEVTRDRVPVGLVNPTIGYPAGALNASPNVGVGQHWWYQLTAADFTAHQLPATLGAKIRRPAGW